MLTERGVYWLEGRPTDGGRSVIVRHADGMTRDVTPPDFNVRTRVHEYGGGAFTVLPFYVVFANFADGCLYRQLIDGSTPVRITAEGPSFFADPAVDPRRRRMVCVREDHSNGAAAAVNTLVAVRMELSDAVEQVIASGYDFYSNPRFNTDGTWLSWLCWNHPQMPWDGTELWAAPVDADGEFGEAMRIAGGPTESIYQPGWLPSGELLFISDRDGWWRPYVCRPSDPSAVRPLLANPPERTEYDRPQWVFGTSSWAAAGDRIVVAWTRGGRWGLGLVDPARGTLRELPLGDREPLDWVAASSTHVVFVASSPTEPDAILRLSLEDDSLTVIARAGKTTLGPADISVPESLTFETTGGRDAQAFYYPPRHATVDIPAGEKPPLIAISHGGPTTATRAAFDLKIQYWTSRGFAVVDVNYGGSSGFGRPYRERLNGKWGIVDVEDVIAATRHLVDRGKADPERLIVRGGSAGGYTTLAALTFHPGVFKAGASYYGVSDVEVLAQDTHKFESRYLDSLIGPYPAMRETYRERSPIHFVDRLASALILFQGLEDKAVPPNQSQMMADAVRAKGLPVAYLTFAGEQHGFRKAETIVRCLEAELAFYRTVFGFGDPLPEAKDGARVPGCSGA